MSHHLLFTMLFFSCPLVALQAQEPKYKSIDAETIAAYEKLGATYGGFRPIKPFVAEFVAGEEAAKKGLPGFRLILLLDEGFPKLPATKVLFGLDLAIRKGADDGLKELKDHGTLTVLHLRGTYVPNLDSEIADTMTKLREQSRKAPGLLYRGDLFYRYELWVTDAGLNEIKSIKNLTELSLSGNPVTDEGMKKLKELDKLKSLTLTRTSVTEKGVKEIKEALPNCRLIREP